MRVFRIGMVLGLGVGYVLGAKAGRERYYQIQAMWRRLMRTEPAQQLRGELRQTAAQAGEALERKASESVAQATRALDEARQRVTSTSPGRQP
jgi:hypothetical protein